MNITDLKRRSAQILDADNGNLPRLTLIHTGILLGASAVVFLISYFLSRQIDTTGGLAGIGMRTTLSAAQTMLTLSLMAATPFWDMGYYRGVLLTARNQNPTVSTLPEGFRRFGPVLRLLLLRLALMMGIGFACLQAASILFMLSPWSLRTLEAMEQLMGQMDAAQLQAMDPAALSALLPTMIPIYVLFGVLLCVILVPLLYRLRLADFAIMDNAPGARAAFRQSGAWMRGNRLDFFKLDLSFWWYYGLQLLAAALAYGDLLTAWLGLPISQDVAYFGFYFLSLGCQLVLSWRFAPQVQTTYAVAYEELKIEK